jgi:hypothetical protein
MSQHNPLLEPRRSDDRTAPVDRDEAYALLGNRRRRNVIHALVAADGRSTVSELARQLAAWETDQPPAAVSSKERKRAYTALRQTHLPKLASCGIVEYDVNRATVALTERGEDLRVYLWRYDRMAQVRLGAVAALTATIVIALAWLGVPPFAAFGGYGLAYVTVAAFAIVTLVSYVRLRSDSLDRSARIADTTYDGVPAGDD